MRHLRIIALSGIMVLLAAGAAHAAGDGHPPLRWMDLFYRVVTTILVIAAIWKLAGKPAVKFFTGRRDGIALELDDLDARKEKAQQDLACVEQRIADLENERAAIIADYEARGEALKKEIIAKAEEQAAQIMNQARQTAQSEIDQALTVLRAELAEKIVAAASESIAGTLSAKDHEKLLNNFLTKNEKLIKVVLQ